MVPARTGASTWPRRRSGISPHGGTAPTPELEQERHVAWTGATPGVRARDVARSTTAGAAIETTELRWFGNGPLPPSVSSWWTNDGARGVVEERCDLYRTDGRVDIGVKLRSLSVLELKVRKSVIPTVPPNDGRDLLGELPRGVVEVWRKWSPADQLVSAGSDPWVEVRKTIIKRRFTIADGEVALFDVAEAPMGAFCDVEVVAIDDGSSAAWSFAFAAHGPRHGRRASIEAAWRALVSGPAPSPRSLVFAVSCGYPEWLQRRSGDPSMSIGR